MNTINVKSKSRQFSNVKMIAISAMFAALVTVATMFIRVPTALGYAHAGDSMVYLAASILGPYGIVASAVGGALSDILSGFANWALPTAIIKACNAVVFVICGAILKKHNKNQKIINLANLLMLIPTSLVTIVGYAIATSFMYSFESALVEVIPNCIQCAVGAIIFVALGAGLDAVKFKERVIG